MDGQMQGQTDGQTDRQTERWADRQTNKWMRRQADEQTDVVGQKDMRTHHTKKQTCYLYVAISASSVVICM